jgi:hypothetical protein
LPNERHEIGRAHDVDLDHLLSSGGDDRRRLDVHMSSGLHENEVQDGVVRTEKPWHKALQDIDHLDIKHRV